MADEEWTTNGTTANSWSTYNYNNSNNPNNSNWTEPNPTTINYNTPPTYMTTTSRQQPPQPPQHRGPTPQQPKKDGFSSLFVAETSFPAWED